MADPDWPSSLPDEPLQQSFSIAGGSGAIASPMDVGPPKRRRRSTLEYETIRVAFVLSIEQIVTFRAFFTDTLKAGTLPFVFKHPIDGDDQRAQIVLSDPPYSITAVSGAIFQLSFTLAFGI